MFNNKQPTHHILWQPHLSIRMAKVRTVTCREWKKTSNRAVREKGRKQSPLHKCQALISA